MKWAEKNRKFGNWTPPTNREGRVPIETTVAKYLWYQKNICMYIEWSNWSLLHKENIFHQSKFNYSDQIFAVSKFLIWQSSVWSMVYGTGKCFDISLQVNGGCSTAPWTTGCMTMKFLPDVNLYGEMQNLQKKLKLAIWSVNYGSAKFKDAQIARF